MTATSYIAEFRERSRDLHQAKSWIAQSDQDRALRDLLSNVSGARAAGLRPVICIDLDLTTLLAHSKSVEVLEELAPSAADFPVPPESAAMSDRLAAIWRGEEHALLPGYTSTAIAAYGVFMTACLEVRSGITLDSRRDDCESWIASAVHARLRNGYWNRDVAADTFSPGFSSLASELVARGAAIVFLSNRDPALREISVGSLSGLLGGTTSVFAFFGPGGSSFDASSKAVAVQRIEEGVGAGLHYGRAVDGKTVFDEVDPGDFTDERQAIVAVIDDRAENRRQIVTAAGRSAALLIKAGLPPPCEIACAAPGFCPEIDIVGTSNAVSSFIITEP